MRKLAQHDEPAGDVTPLTLLVIDDERAVRALLRRMLEPHICRVVEAADGGEALALIESYPAPIDAVLTDLRMPTMDGAQVIEALARRSPRLPVLAMTGYGDDGGISASVKLLMKPFEPRDVIGAVIDALVKGRALRGAAASRPRKGEAPSTSPNN
jgi:CheY-like chemotaxis protein